MNAPRRLLKDSGTALEMALLRSAKGDGPPAGALERAMAAVDASRGAGAPSVSFAPGMNLARWAGEFLKWMTIGVAGGALFHGDFFEAKTQGAEDPSAIIRTEGPAVPRDAETAGLAANLTVESSLLEPGVDIDAREVTAPDAHRRASPEPHERQKRAALTTGAPKVAAPSLAEEIALLDAARRALARRDPGAALAALDKHAKSFPAGALRPEAAVLRVDILMARGDRSGAAAAARALLDAHPAGPYASHLRVIAGDLGQASGAAPSGK